MSMPDRIRYKQPDSGKIVQERVIGCRVLRDWVWWRTASNRFVDDTDVLDRFGNRKSPQ